jgi:hypothetical protein
VRIYVTGGPEEGSACLADLARMGHQAATAQSGGREAAAACEMVLAFDTQADAAGRAGGPALGLALGVELGLALGGRKRVWLVGRAELGPGAADFATAGLFRTFAGWEEARSELEAAAPASEPPGPAEPPPELSLDMGALADDCVLRMWQQHGVSTLTLHPHLEKYAPGLSARVLAYRRCRQSIYAAVLDAWGRAGRPHSFSEGDPVAAPWADHAACMAWFGGCIRLAQFDAALDEIAEQRQAALSAFRAGGQLSALPAAIPAPGTGVPIPAPEARPAARQEASAAAPAAPGP